MPRIVNCPGSVAMGEKFPESSDGDHNAADQGTLAHWLATKKLTQNVDPLVYLHKSPINQEIVDVEMVQHVNEYCEFAKKIGEGWAEQRYEMGTGEFSGFGGTPDFIFYNRTTGTLTILDLKYGFIPVSALKNWQLLSYAWLFHKHFPEYEITTLTCWIYQPRGYSTGGITDMWSIWFRDALGEYFPAIENALRECVKPDAPTKTGDHCHYCTAMLQCSANLQSCLKIINVTGAQSGQEPTDGELAGQLKLLRSAAKTLKKRLSIVESTVEVRLRVGKPVPGYKLQFSHGNRYWDISPERASWVGIPTKPVGLMSPRQSEIAGMPREIIDKYTTVRTSVKVSEIDMLTITSLLNQELNHE